MVSIVNTDSHRFRAVAPSLGTAHESAARVWDIDLPGEQNEVLHGADLRSKLSSLVWLFLILSISISAFEYR